jgi:hypothetical protein
LYDFNTHFELEDLPTTWDGYNVFPLRSKYFLKTGKDILAMSGKFHTMWGEFGGFKHPDAIRYEAAAMTAYGAACSFGDQLHPSGKMDMDTYRNIGEAYEYVEKIEAYGIGSIPVSRLGLWLSFSKTNDMGVVNMLLESHNDFVIVNENDRLSEFETIVLPGAAILSNDQAEKLNRYVQEGGSLLILGNSALDKDRKRFILDVGAEYLGGPDYEVDYLVAGNKLRKGLVSSPFLNYTSAIRMKPEHGTDVLASIREPYFNRTYARYSSHKNTPYQMEDADHPGAIRKGNVVYLPHPVGRMYFEYGARIHRDFFTNALQLIYTHPMIRTDLPSEGRVSLLHQPQHRRYIGHLLYASPIQRGKALVIEDLVPLNDIPVKLQVPEKVLRAYLVPGHGSLELKRDGHAVKVSIPEFQCHTAVVFEY